VAIGNDVPVTRGRIYSIGYEGLTQRALVSTLVQNEVALVVDVRLNPVSRRPGFSKRGLAEALAKAGIDYVHEPDLGNPTTNRAAFKSPETLEGGRRKIRRRLNNGSRDAVERLVEHARSKRRVAVLCVERGSPSCHRSVVTEVAQEFAPGLEVLEVL
jgi:uncharacterized protein (DUF488 family)